MDQQNDRYKAAINIVREASDLARSYYLDRDRLQIDAKGAQDFVTEADKKTEELIRSRLDALYPEDGILGEEGGGGEAARLWIIDPIDGTANFIRGLPYWSVCLSYVENNVPLIGVTADPVHQEIFSAQKGGGSFRNGEKIKVSDLATGEKGCVGLSFNFKQEAQAYSDLIANVSRLGHDHRRMGSTALSLCHTADGRIDGTISLNCKIWDCMAGLILVSEAGGFSTDIFSHYALEETVRMAAATRNLVPDLLKAAGDPTLIATE